MAGGWDETRRQNGKTQSHEHAQKNAPRTHLPVLGALPRVHSIMPVLFRHALLVCLCIERFANTIKHSLSYGGVNMEN